MPCRVADFSVCSITSLSRTKLVVGSPSTSVATRQICFQHIDEPYHLSQSYKFNFLIIMDSLVYKNKKTPCPVTECDAMLYISLIFRITAGFGTLQTQVAGLHRAVPSTTLDKV